MAPGLSKARPMVSNPDRDTRGPGAPPSGPRPPARRGPQGARHGHRASSSQAYKEKHGRRSTPGPPRAAPGLPASNPRIRQREPAPAATSRASEGKARPADTKQCRPQLERPRGRKPASAGTANWSKIPSEPRGPPKTIPRPPDPPKTAPGPPAIDTRIRQREPAPAPISEDSGGRTLLSCANTKQYRPRSEGGRASAGIA